MLEQGITTLKLLKPSKIVENDLKRDCKVCRAGLTFMKQTVGEPGPTVIRKFASSVLDSLDCAEDIICASQSPINRTTEKG